ncbi:ABC transporter ATP-binding protein [candidate division CSSED10-310 bacterium]|uniref:ABC transporter ATP-binding protein n=1 Tax=candidate division CSSED10-310 bacterium TaxID=2855610 RepID=A0ABV6YR40_UNCC1
MLDIQHLKTYFYTEEGIIKAVDDVSFAIDQGTTLGLVGESGCGKSVTALSIMRLIEDPPGKIISGQVLLKGQDLLQFPEKKMRSIRGNEISMIFQEPMTSLNPVFTIGNQMMETLRLHQGLSKQEAEQKAIAMLTSVHIPDAAKRFKSYPHQMSGGMIQRVMIAMALSCNPSLIIADEPTTALDVTIQAQILNLLSDLKERYQLSLLLITHDLGIVAEVADRVAVMYAGKIVEEGAAQSIFSNPCHPYTLGLLASIPRIDGQFSLKDHLSTIEGIVPNPLDLPPGCSFEPRCSWRLPQCSHQMPPRFSDGEKQHVSCFLYQNGVLESAVKTSQTTIE